MALFYNIAGHVLEITGVEPGYIPGFSPFLLEPTISYKPLISVRLGQQVLNPVSNPLYQFSIEEGTCQFMKNNDSYFVRWSQTGGMNWLMEIKHQEDEFVVVSDMNQRTDIHILRFSIWIAFGIAALFRQTVAVHASTLMYCRRSILFLGESGTGKSTQSRLWREHFENTELLNDDSPFIVIEKNGDSVVWGSPWSGKTACYKNKHTSIVALVRLRQAPFNSIRRLRTIEAIGALQPSLPPIFATEPVLINLMDECMSDILGQVPVYIMDCLPNKEAVELLYNTLSKGGRLC
ncbi:MAG: hypothetical protein LBS20_20250 [Prevotella sp.]|jgi:hypothetical protein|nr:hypothetical protein [Prevotella sp.]